MFLLTRPMAAHHPLCGGKSDRFVNRSSARQAHDSKGAKRVAWLVEPKRRDVPIIGWRSSSTIACRGWAAFRLHPLSQFHWHVKKVAIPTRGPGQNLIVSLRQRRERI